MQTEDFDVQEIYNKALEQLSFLDYKNALKLFEQIKDEMDVNLYIAECKENLEKEENGKEYVRGSSAAKMYLQHNNLSDLRNAISIFEGLAKKDYKDSVEQYALLKKTYQKELVRIN